MTQTNLQALRRSLARHLKEKAELEQQVRAVQSRVQAEIAPLQEEVLRLRMERLKEAAQTHMRSARLRNAYHDAQEAYQRFREQRSRDPQPVAPSDEDLKVTYRRATKRCHPDAVPDSYREEAVATFRALESAYQQDHPSAVRAIAEDLKTWGFPEPPAESTEASASDERTALRRAVSDLDAAIDRLRASDAYQSLSASSETEVDVEAVVGAQKRALQKQLHKLQRRQHSRP